MTSEVFVGTLCGVGLGLLVGIICSIVYVYWRKKRQNAERLTKTRRKSHLLPSGRAIIPHDIPEFQIPPIVPIPIQAPTREFRTSSSPTLSPPVTPRSQSARRASVQLDDILTSVSANNAAIPRKQSPTSFSSTNEAAIANLYSQQKKAIAGKRKLLKRSSTSCPYGKLEFSLFYDQNLQELQIYVVRGIQLYIPGSDGATSLVLKAVILFDGEEVWQDKTKVVEDGSDPDFSEQLTVRGLSMKRMRKGLLKLIVFDQKTEQAAGEVVYPLSSLPFNFFTTEVMKLAEVDAQEYSTEEDSQSKQNGEVLISMCHNRNEKKLTVVVDCAKNLPVMYRGSVDSFVKVEIMFVGKKLHSRTTPVITKNRSPDYSAKFDFVIPDDKLPQITVVFKVKHQGKLRDHSIGMVKLGYDAQRDTEYRHLEQVLDKPHLSIENWHIIEKYK